ncbi:MAG: NADPH:quinone oxidoreductase family protein, partial [Betaproteobacteria bacterium]|nr:NADPH:quinone oxidoreductase family protein [Betaproteobacteria bacterium]
EVRELPSPEPGPGQIRVDVHAAGVNFPDSLIIRNLYQFKPELPFSPGGEIAGVISALGEGVEGLRVGDAVMALCGHGGFAQQALVEAAKAVRIPAGVAMDMAASFTMVYATSYHGLADRAQLKAGESLLVLGAAGGVGLAAVEIGKALGARVIAAASSDEKLEVCRAHGADACINYSRDDLREQIKHLTAGQGVDVVYDPVGGQLAEPAFRSMAWRGRFLVIGFALGQIPSLPLNLALLKGASIVGVFWGAYVAREPSGFQDDMAQLLSWVREGKLKPRISARYSLDDAPKAIRALMDRSAIGKLVVLPTP